MSYSVYGCWATPFDEVAKGMGVFTGNYYLVAARCDDGCHVAQACVADDALDSLPNLATDFEQAFRRQHP